MDTQITLFTTALDMIANVGFPIFISLFLLHRMESKVDAIVVALKDLTTVMSHNNK
ncbi:MAG: YvrJ family protein [Alkalibacterium sp.]|uniref:YvrJ protein family protein n=1 Tax=Alkalibacterium gilvum TaxID=1130080 RepID=A0A1H6UD10_9LACT|nr:MULTISPECIES: YvrJ family protein [Alkalibacterium]MDN6193881.1 YvrJ family protein [Alkalibacterium sp.]MDN6294226.1 YvrJ family protein [Alkalibacterium sp.]MDN6295964.1 YvrJ family protein [Alkalibacterium sp.]MDN6326610.1 YvrJ family protein [Alkalibacterium sp.]MDN6385722.1 YvrJ family protein [Alkalibacterium sp.]